MSRFDAHFLAEPGRLIRARQPLPRAAFAARGMDTDKVAA